MEETQVVIELRPEFVVSAYEAAKLGERSRQTMATSNWPTVLAHPCEAYAVFNRIVPPKDRRKIGTDLAMVFSEGIDQQRMVKRDLIDAGFEVSGEEEQMAWPQFQISGRRDLLVWKAGFKSKVRVEVKSCSPWTFESINSLDDLIGSSKVWLAKWWKQIALYMVLQAVERYWLLLKNKQTGKIKIIEFLMDDRLLEAAEAMLKKAEKVNHLVQIGQMPSKEMKISDPDFCSECEFFTVCLSELELGPGAEILTDEQAAEMAAQLDRRAELEGAYKEYKELDDELKGSVKTLALGGVNKVVAGDWIASVKELEKKCYTVPAHKETRVTFMRVERPASDGQK